MAETTMARLDKKDRTRVLCGAPDPNGHQTCPGQLATIGVYDDPDVFWRYLRALPGFTKHDDVWKFNPNRAVNPVTGKKGKTPNIGPSLSEKIVCPRCGKENSLDATALEVNLIS